MTTFSLCMIVKNEEKTLARCLDSIADLMDEIIIIDTGSTDATKEIAGRYTDRVYDYAWTGDFSDARNYSFSLATGDYIYAADADEVLDPENHKRLSDLKQVLLPEVEIVQMKYHTISPEGADYDTVLNCRMEYRPKLYKRLRTWTWQDPVHEMVRLSPVVFDSDIVIEHRPDGLHNKRDFSIFINAYKKQGYLSDNLWTMYATELLKTGDPEDLKAAAAVYAQAPASAELEAACVLARYYRLFGLSHDFEALGLADIAADNCSELCYELAAYLESQGQAEQALGWYEKALTVTRPALDIHTGGDKALGGMSRCYWALGQNDAADQYAAKAKKWELPLEFD